MKNPLEKKTNILVPVLLGAAAAAAITYFLIADETSALRMKLMETLGEEWDGLKGKLADKAEDLTALKDEVVEKFTTGTKSAEDAIQ